uniref:Uncharacterized protein n=1 Tax=Anguilla anguilla TaxID=7936 RepID=A0A0E9WCX2_ANGAN
MVIYMFRSFLIYSQSTVHFRCDHLHPPPLRQVYGHNIASCLCADILYAALNYFTYQCAFVCFQ